jgi:hypothetical protein
MPEGAIYVGRPSRWGNPFRVGDYAFFNGLGTYPVATTETTGPWPHPGLQVLRIRRADEAVQWFRDWYVENQADRPYWGTAALRGHDLVCWCPLDQPCHADVLLQLANA